MAEQGKSFYEASFGAAADLSAKQYHLMRLAAADSVNQSSHANDTGYIGILQNKPQSGESASIRRGGKQKVVAGASASVGALFTTNGSGRAIAVASGTNAVVMGKFLEAPGANGDIVTVDVFQSPYVWPGLAI